MKNITFFFVLGTRPEIIKFAPLIHKLRNFANTIVINTNQQQNLSTDFMQEFEITPNYTLINNSERSLNLDISSFIFQLNRIISSTKTEKSYVFVQGDTSSAVSGAISGFNLEIPVFHLEAGLRSGNRKAPFPEEVYRRIITQIATHHFSPTEGNKRNLIQVGIDGADITVCGNTGIDTLSNTLTKIKYPVDKSEFRILVTLHRRENFGRNINLITEMLGAIPSDSSIKLNFINHPNPLVRKSIHNNLLQNKDTTFLKPQNYVSMIELIVNSNLVITDSGGLQEETAFLGIPLIVAREVTERDEIFKTNCILCSVNPNEIKKSIYTIKDNEQGVTKYFEPNLEFGKGDSAEIVIETLISKGWISRL